MLVLPCFILFIEYEQFIHVSNFTHHVNNHLIITKG